MWSKFGFLFTGPSLKPQQPRGKRHEICHDSSREEWGCLGMFPAMLLWKLLLCYFHRVRARRKQAKDLWCAMWGSIHRRSYTPLTRASFVSLSPGSPYPDLAQVLPIFFFFPWSITFQSFIHISAFLRSGGSLPSRKWNITGLPQFGPEVRDQKSCGYFLSVIVVWHSLLLIYFWFEWRRQDFTLILCTYNEWMTFSVLCAHICMCV